MAHTLVKFPSYRLRPPIPSTAKTVAQSSRPDLKSGPQVAVESSDLLPCVLYERNTSGDLTYVSTNAFELLGIDPSKFLGGRELWEERLLREDLRLLLEKIERLEAAGSGSLVHRILDDRGLPRWVAHSFRKIQVDRVDVIRGCMIPMPDEQRLHNVDRGIISRFIHKIGNQFQLLNLSVNALQKAMPESKESEMLQQTVERAIEVTRMFSDYSQSSPCVSDTDLFEILNAAVVTRRSLFAARGVALEEEIDESVGRVTIAGDPFLLESAIGGVIQNALDATERGGRVVFKASVEMDDASAPPVARLLIADSGCGIREEDMEKVIIPFYSSKKDHDGLGLSMATRFVEMLGGVLKIDSLPGKGTEIRIAFPTNVAKRLSDR